MALSVCEDCTTLFTPDAPKCPHCGSKLFHEVGTPKPKRKAAKP